MAISVKILADSVAPYGKRLTTREWTYPRSIHAEVLTHKMFSKNSASSRAIPTEKLIQRVLDDPFVPKYIGANQKGMQAGAELDDEKRAAAVNEWLAARDFCVARARHMTALGVHKQVVNRVIEPWMWITIIISATENDNLWGLRCHEAAEPHFQELAYMDRAAVQASTPKQLGEGAWHLPLIFDEDRHAAEMMYDAESHPPSNNRGASIEDLLIKVSVGRCARVSYLTHDGRRAIEEDVALHDRLVVQTPLHASPAEHIAQAMDYPQWYKERFAAPAQPPPLFDLQQLVLKHRGPHLTEDQRAAEAALAQMRSGNFLGFRQYRKMLLNEHIGGRMP